MVKITKNHIRLLKRAYWRFEDCEYGAPAIDCKRPYGNSDVEGDIADILGFDRAVCPNCGTRLDDGSWEETARTIHGEMVDVIREIISNLEEHNYPEE